VVHRFQSPAQSTGLPVHRTSGRSPSSIYQVRKVFIFLLAGYKRLISPLLPSACRFYPTCSQYMSEAIELHGAGKGIWLGIKRLGRCHPFHEGGTDLVPRPHAHNFGLKSE
jgi:putative membrane protein insertion efficiency factor